MSKQKQPQNQTTLKDYLNGYDQQSLNAALNTLESSLGFELFKAYGAYVQRQYEVTSLDAVAKSDMVQAAAYASGYAKGVSDLLNEFIPGLRASVAGKLQTVEHDRPEE